MAAPLTRRLRAQPLQAHGEAYLGLAWPALAWLEHNVDRDMRTLETGAGASTVVFAAAGASHVAISPSKEEHQRISRYCEEEGISLDRVSFIAESSHTALPQSWKADALDVVLIDGAHSFPFPILDWLYTSPHLKVGGYLLVDDAYQPTANLLTRFLRTSPSWQLYAVPGHRTPCFRKLDDRQLSFDWDDFALGRPRFDYLPPLRRAVAWLRFRLFERPPLRGG